MFIIHQKLVKQYVKLMKRVNGLEQTSATDKVALALLDLPEQLGLSKRFRKSRLRVSITQQEIANSIGLTRETTGLELNKLRLKKLINYSRSSYTLYMDRLRDYLKKRSE
jgi:CRP-like cAMP-binding protein